MEPAAGHSSPAALSAGEFAARLDRLGPFERRPFIAVGVSGGADSMALALLADRWARARQGRIAALTVDHRLRADSAAEAQQVGRWIEARGIAHAILVWHGPYPTSNRQAAARAARYRLLEEWCRGAGCLHLLMAHHAEDQAETFWLRLAHGSGLDGLAAMPAVSERAGCRVLRPLLDVAPARLQALLAAEGQVWIEDPSNRNPDYARVRVRQSRAVLEAEGLGADRLAETIDHLGAGRAALEAATAALLARAAVLHPAGFLRLDRGELAAAVPEIALRALAAAIAAIGGADYAPRQANLDRLAGEILMPGAAEGRTLGGCLLVPRGAELLVCREPAALEGSRALEPGVAVKWDGRFTIMLPRQAPRGFTAGALGSADRGLPKEAVAALVAIPGPARPSLAVLRDPGGIACVPALAWVRPGFERAFKGLRAEFRSTRPLAPLGFTVV